MIDYPIQYGKPEPVWKSIPGFFDFDSLYSKLAKEVEDQQVMVEIGCFLGKSACYLGEELQKLGKQVTLLCIDVWPHNYRYGDFIYAEAPFDTFCANVRQSGLTQIILPFRCDSIRAAKLITSNLFSVFIDGDHTYEGCRGDILAWKDKVIPGGYVAGHDYALTGPWEAVSRAVKSVFGEDFQVAGRSWIHRVKT